MTGADGATGVPPERHPDEPSPAAAPFRPRHSAPDEPTPPAAATAGPAPTTDPEARTEERPGKRSSTRPSRRVALVIGVVVVVVAGLAVGAWALFLRGGSAVTWQGEEVSNADAVLQEAQNDLATLVSQNKGVEGDDTRCWFAVQDDPPKGTPDTDVTDTVYCGPALFVDGDTAKPYVPYGLAAEVDGGEVTLSLATRGTEDGATSVPRGEKLVRPDGASAPSGAGGLTAPEPPPAPQDVFTSAGDLDVPAAPAGATMAALDGGVTVDELGVVERYGAGVDARSAPTGQKLIAFHLRSAPGDGGSDGPGALDLTVAVDGAAGRKVPDLSAVNVIAVPDDAKSVVLTTSANGIQQSVSLLDGKPASGNIAVLARANTLGTISPPAGFTLTESATGASAERPCTLTGSVSGLFYWSDDTGTVTASSPGKALLETDLKYAFSTAPPLPFNGANVGIAMNVEPAYLTLALPDGTKVAAQTVSGKTVFEVPATFTQGTVTIGGTTTNPNGVTFTVASPVSFTISIPTTS